MNSKDSKRTDLRDFFTCKEAKSLALSDRIITAMKRLAEDPTGLEDCFVLRDSIDIARTVISRFLNYSFIRALNEIGNGEAVRARKKQYMGLLDSMSDILNLHSDFSIYRSLKQIEAAAPTNPNFEITLKRNICNSYCAQPAAELVEFVFKAEAETVFDWLTEARAEDTWDFTEQYKTISDRFMHTPLENMQNDRVLDPATVLSTAANRIAVLLGKS